MVPPASKCSQCGEFWYTDHQCKAAPAAGVPAKLPTEVEAKYTLTSVRELIARSEVDFDTDIGG
jgi:hypothetical protein